MTLDSLREMLRAASALPLHDRSVAEARLVQAAEPTDPVAPDDLEVTELASPVPIRLFRPRSPDPVPVCVWFSGGGWVLDTRATSESSCRRLARETPCAVALVGYRLAPEHRFPVPLEDCFAATGYVVADGATNGLDARRIAVGGTSAGGNLAAAVALLARDRPGVRLAAQILVYPALLHGADTASMRESYAPGELDRRGVDWCWSHYLASAADGLDPLASPLLADDLRGLPPALVLTAELDPLRDEGALYAQRLEAAGVRADHTRFDGAPHGFFSSPGALDAARAARQLAAAFLRRAFEP